MGCQRQTKNMKNEKDKLISNTEKIIGYTFKSKDTLVQALTHRSYTNENKNVPHNERLEFFGDAILQYASTKKLFQNFKDESEGVLSMYRSILVKTEYLADIAIKLNIAKYIQTSEGQKREFEKNKMSNSILANAIEALIGAIHLDGGLKPAITFIEDKVLRDIDKYLSNIPLRDPKTELQEYTQDQFGVTPEYIELENDGPAHNKNFTVGVKIGKEIIQKGEGKSKQEAEKKAAEQVLKKYNKTSQK